VADATRTENAKNLRSMRDKDRQMVKGVFKYYEVPGGSVGFCFKKYKEDPIEKFDLVDGQIYTIPLGVANILIVILGILFMVIRLMKMVYLYSRLNKSKSYGVSKFRVYGYRGLWKW